MPRTRKGQRYVEGSTCKKIWRTPGKKEAIPMYLANGLLLANYEKGHSRICKEMPWLPSASCMFLDPLKHNWINLVN